MLHAPSASHPNVQRPWRLALAAAALLAGCGGSGEPAARHASAPPGDPSGTTAGAAATLPGGRYVIRNVHSHKCVEVAGAATGDGGNIQQNSCTGALNQAFDVSEVSAGVYRLLAAHSGKAMDVSGASTSDGANVQQWHDNGTAAQRFRLQSDVAGGYALVNLNSNKCVDVAGASTGDAANIQQYGCNGTGAQRFVFEPVGAGVVDLGPNVKVFDPSMSADAIQAELDDVYRQQETNQFGPQRHAFLFKPGTYHNFVRVGYYTQVLGLGRSPNDVTIHGGLHVDAEWFGQNATQNFWRGAENLSVVPGNNNTMVWAVSQAVPFRRMHVQGNLHLFDRDGWSSGGFIADSKIDGTVISGSQQQWLSRNAEFGRWEGGVWNMMFVGAVNAPAPSFPDPPHTVLEQTPLVREKPYLTVDTAGQYSVVVPELRSNSRGVSWAQGASAGQVLPLSQFHVAKPAIDTAATINAALDAGKHLLFTPGIYRLDQTLRIRRSNTVVLGLGLATLVPVGGITAMAVDDVDGVKIAGLLFDAGETVSPALLEVGPVTSAASHAANPTSLHDLFFRVGGTGALGRADASLVINSHHVIGDHFWVWRADHGEHVGWDINTSRNGVIVNGDDVRIYGLFVEHFHEYQTLWRGERGQLYFYQSEIPYDVPSQAAWMNNGANGFASYKVADDVTEHAAWGLGIYCFFQANPSLKLGNAIEAPQRPGVRFHNMTTVSLGGVGEITHIINGRGDTVNAEPGRLRATLPQ
ncbi:RICIN domain-containing protein [Eleftheria terrae]|uniref:RICIN domain-containing protein n=1 Tax=Eleftheria terrae TaxID=1597781 RepID=UPI00263B3D73|nr:RICIN domain-containing protein [Eleftheria terrae]WKB55417.1 RICIN domain-containing protein [Eleftheria terrae]